jgi:hypothetical protein
MTDQEILESAAAAAGIQGEYRTELLCVSGDWIDVTAIHLPDGDGYWNPLEDDGDALRLAVQLDLLFSPLLSRIHSEVLAELGGSDPDLVARRAIVIAAVRASL